MQQDLVTLSHYMKMTSLWFDFQVGKGIVTVLEGSACWAMVTANRLFLPRGICLADLIYLGVLAFPEYRKDLDLSQRRLQYPKCNYNWSWPVLAQNCHCTVGGCYGIFVSNACVSVAWLLVNNCYLRCALESVSVTALLVLFYCWALWRY